MALRCGLVALMCVHIMSALPQARNIILDDVEVDRLQQSEASHLLVKRNTQSSTAVGFTAQLTGAALNNLAIGTTVLYNTVLTNEGSCYDSSTGICTIQTSGLYMCSFFVNAAGSPEANLVLKVDGVSTVQAMSDNDDSAGNMLVRQINAGQSVWIETVENIQSLSPGYTTFSCVCIG